MVKLIIGIVLIAAGVIVGCYVGIWLMFIGGILSLAHGIDAHTVTATMVAISAIKIILSGFVGLIIGYALAAAGLLILND